MKKRNQIDQRRAVQQFRLFAIEQNANILPVADIVGLLEEVWAICCGAPDWS